MLSIRGKQSVDLLADIYQHTSDEAVKKAILQAYLVTGSPDKLVEAARNESNPQLVRAAVQSLGAMGATAQLQTLYNETKSHEVKEHIINSLIAAGPKGAEVLGTIATTEQDPDLRRKAIRNLGISGGPDIAPKLVATYQNNTDPETKKAAVEALFLAGDATISSRSPRPRKIPPSSKRSSSSSASCTARKPPPTCSKSSTNRPTPASPDHRQEELP